MDQSVIVLFAETSEVIMIVKPFQESANIDLDSNSIVPYVTQTNDNVQISSDL